VLVVASTVALWASYSRSAAVAAIVAVGLVIVVSLGKRYGKYVAAAMVAVALLGTTGLIAFRDSSFVSHVVLHANPQDESATNSNEGHAESLADGAERMINQPFGAGVGSTGSASLQTDTPLIIENQYLMVAHEVGWLGALTFIAIFGLLLRELWQRRGYWLALGVGASGIGMAIIGVLLPVWVDDTVSIVWWGLAAIALAVGSAQNRRT